MNAINGYKIIEKLGETPVTIVYRALKEGFENTVVLKLLKARFPSPGNIARLKHEYDILREIKSEYILKTYEMFSHDEGFVLVSEDINGLSLDRFLKLNSMFGIAAFLDMGPKLCSALANLHRRNIVHKDIKPGNILFNPNKNLVRITDFGISTLLTTPFNESHMSPGAVGTLKYMPPEQTGRMTLDIDHRSDLYALGATFYEMLTGRPPFMYDDPMELIHAHIARKPDPLSRTRPEAPEVISDIILKLLSKNPENRYQSALGLKEDLERCRNSYQKTAGIPHFKIGSKDISEKLIIPSRLIGREKEVDLLMSAFNRLAEKPANHQPILEAEVCADNMILVSGEPGVGKSALIDVLDKAVTKKNGFFFSVKFEKTGGKGSYRALMPVLNRLIRYFLSQNEEHISPIRELLRAALGQNGKLITDLFPDLEKLIGPQPDVEELEPNESRNRFTKVFENFIGVFINQPQTTAIFFDDLQWADQTSMSLIEKLATASRENYLLIGSFRENEVDSLHPLALMLSKLEKDGFSPARIRLAGLTISQVTAFLAGCLKCPEMAAIELAEVIHDKTGGNPFFVHAFLHALQKNDLLNIDDSGKWAWDMDAIRQMNITDNVADLLSQKMAELFENTREIIQIGACIGNCFDLDTLSEVSGMDLDELLSALDEIMEQRFISLSRNRYRFEHERIREITYAMIPASSKAQHHYKIGHTVLAHHQGNPSADKLFYVTDQLNLAADIITDPEERRNLIRMNRKCGEKAQKSAAFQPALHYFSTGIELSDTASWEKDYRLCMTLYSRAVETAYLASEYTLMDRLAKTAITSADNLLDAIPVYNTLIHAHTAQNNFTQAIRIALDVLKQLNFPIPENPGKLRIGAALMKIKPALSGNKIDHLLKLPDATDPRILAIFAILSNLSRVSFVTSPELFAYATIKCIQLSLKHGNCKNNASAYMGLAILMINALNDIETGCRLGDISLELIKKYNAKGHEARTLAIHNMMVGHWKMDLPDLVAEYTRAYQLGIETGDIEYSALCLLMRNAVSLLAGGNLTDLEIQGSETNAAIRALHQLPSLNLNFIFIRNILVFMDKDESESAIPPDAPTNEEIIVQWEEENAGAYLGIFHVYRLLQEYYFGRYENALASFTSAGKYKEPLASMIPIKDYYFYGTLTLVALFPEALAKQKKFIRKQVDQCLKKYRKWAFSNPVNTTHRIKFIEAEWARVSENHVAAQQAYDQAIALAENNSYPVEAALIYERAGDYYKSQGLNRIAQIYWTAAHHQYSAWGAVSKQKQLQKDHPELLSSINISAGAANKTNTTLYQTSVGTSNQVWDLNSVLKASHAISGERELGRLLEKMMEITIENAGAQKGLMVLESGGDYFVEAEKNIDRGDIQTLKSIPVKDHKGLSVSIVNYVARTHEALILHNAAKEGDFTRAPYIKRHRPKSVLCAPIINQGRLVGIIYLENNLSAGVFTSDRMELINILSSQMAISIENAKFYQELEEKVSERTLQLHNANEKLKNLSLVDPLTNLNNRRYLHEIVSEISDNFINNLMKHRHKSERRNQNKTDKIFGVYLLDIDHFKSVNDTYGHLSGDAVLVQISEVLKNMIRADDIIVRWGGEEFLIILQNINREYLEVFARRVLTAIRQTRLTLPNSQSIVKTCSIGYTQLPLFFCQPDLLNLEQTINLSDYALYRAKENGRDQAMRLDISTKTPMDEAFQAYLTSLSKNSEYNEAFIRVTNEMSVSFPTYSG